MVPTPSTGKGVLIAIGAVGVVLLYFFTVSGLLTIAVGAAFLAVFLYLVWVLAVRFNRWATRSRPWRRSGGEGGD